MYIKKWFISFATEKKVHKTQLHKFVLSAMLCYCLSTSINEHTSKLMITQSSGI